MVGWHHQFNGHEFEQALGCSEGQRSLVCCSPRAHKESDVTGQLNHNSDNKVLCIEPQNTGEAWGKQPRKGLIVLNVKV